MQKLRSPLQQPQSYDILILSLKPGVVQILALCASHTVFIQFHSLPDLLQN